MLSIDKLKELNQRIYFFGLGFIQVVTSDYERYHFYSEELETVTDYPHNHRYGFISDIIKGELIQKIYTTIPGSTHLLYQESCKEGVEAPQEEVLVGLKELNKSYYKEGSLYRIDHETLHSISVVGNTITHLYRGMYEKEFADIVRPKEDSRICPFTNKIPETQLWEIIREML